MLFITINAIVQLFRDYAERNWVVIILMIAMVLVDIIAHKQNLIRLINDKENTADLHEGLVKDIEKLKSKKQEKLNKNSEKKKKINEKYEKKIAKKNEEISRINELVSSNVEKEDVVENKGSKSKKTKTEKK